MELLKKDKNISLLVMAGGLGTRFGGLKQVAGFGPNEELILEYSIYDAIRTGFTKVIFILNTKVENYFRETFIPKISPFIQVEIVVQNLRNVPGGHKVADERTKPLGTAHAVWSANAKISEPFAVINGDDFYGLAAFKEIAAFLKNQNPESYSYAMAGYQVKNTLSGFGPVARGVCVLNEDGYLQTVNERTHIETGEKGIFFMDEKNQQQIIPPNTLVSMNLFGLMPSIFTYLEEHLIQFIAGNNNNLTGELYLPKVIDNLITDKKATVKVLQTDAKWFGVTYAADKEVVMKNLSELIKSGEYPNHLWQF